MKIKPFVSLVTEVFTGFYRNTEDIKMQKHWLNVEEVILEIIDHRH